MFHSINKNIQARMSFLEKLDADDRIDGTERIKRLRQIPSETGKFLAIMASMAPSERIIEIGTSAGYSTLWLTLAAKLKNQKVITFELLKEKIVLAKETFRLADVEGTIELIEGDARNLLENYSDISFCFLDAEKEDYNNYYDIIIPKLVAGGLLIADNVISHKEALEPFIIKAQEDNRVDVSIVPIGKGELICRKI
ncbi:MAG: O-methyltransferase [candidate division Zixibacteria bacterium]|nr:O-methyltransferase [candidate division Zixibacteria bacterium]